ncbi:hypothetical protein BGZ93_007647 [Podila epicladia]|nr:hypothetical protein BGZ93_007647 [Podila epicladia]
MALFQVMKKHGFECFDVDSQNRKFMEFRKMVVSTILATDMGLHFDYVGKIKEQTERLRIRNTPEGSIPKPNQASIDEQERLVLQAPVWAVRREAHLLTDPQTGAIWYLGGSTDKGETNEIDKFLNGGWSINLATTQVDPTSGDVKAYVMNRFSSGTSHIYKNKIYLFGGSTSTPDGQRSYQSFQSIPTIDISAPQLVYGEQLTIGAVPKPRNDHCSVLTASQKVIIYGGYDPNTKYTFNDVWSLDLVTMTWTQIVTTSSPRYSHTCNLAGANMIVFGGRASSTSTSKDVGYRDVQVYDVTTSTWQLNYTVKMDTTPASQPFPVSTPVASKKGLTTGAIVGVIIGVVALILVVGGLVYYRRRQKMIEVHEAEVEKAAYLASLASDDDGNNQVRKSSQRYHKNNPYSASSPRSPSTRRLNGTGTSTLNSPTLGYGSGFESVESPAVPGASNVQYLMQHLPDGTIAVQPVYLDHQPIPLQHSPNMMYSENSSLGGYVSTPISPSSVQVGVGVGEGTSGTSLRQGYVAPPPPVPGAAHVSSTSGPTDYHGQSIFTAEGENVSSVENEQPSAKDPFGSPASTRAAPLSSPRQTRRQ